MKNTVKMAALLLTALIALALTGCPEAVTNALTENTVTIKAIEGVTTPVTGETPVTAVTETAQYTGSVSWFPQVNGTFAPSTQYQATITLRAKSGYTLIGVAENFFTVEEATSVRSAANFGVINAVFPRTAGTAAEPAVIDIAAIAGITAPVTGGEPAAAVTETAQYTGAVAWFPQVSGTFAASTQYMAVITLTAKSGFTLIGVDADSFTVADAVSATNAADSGVITAVFSKTAGTAGEPAVVDIASIAGITAPVTGGTPAAAVTETVQYTGTVSWFPQVSGTFAPSTQYMATITLTAKNGFTFNGVDADSFTVADAVSATNAADSGVVTAVFPTTAGTIEHPSVIDIAEIEGITFPVSGGTPAATITETAQYTGSVAWNGSPSTFAEGTAYTAVITLTAKPGYTLEGVGADFFTVAGAAASNAAGSGIVTAEFPPTGATPVFGITLSVSGTRSFGTVSQGYTSASPVVPVIITNTSGLATGPLTVSLSGAGANSFTLSATSISSIVANGVSSFEVRRRAGLAEGVYEATVTVSGGNGITAAFDVHFIVTALPYVINGSGATFTATRGGETIGTADQPIQTVINDIRADADGGIAAIQFGNGAAALDIGTASVSFANTTEEEWGTVTLLGKITSAVSSTTTGTVIIADPVSLTSAADIANTAATNGRAVYHNSTGTVTISGGTVQATTGVAVYNASTGKAVVSGTAKVTSANVTSGNGTIVIANSGTDTDTRLEISGGTVENTGEGTTSAVTVYNASTGAVSISGGTVSAISSGRAVYNNTTGAVNISGGTVSSVTGYAVNNAGTGTVTVSGGAVSSLTSVGVYNSSGGAVTISGGTVSSISNMGVYNSSTGTVSISGGTVSSLSKAAVAIISTGKVTISGNALVTSATVENILTGGNPGTIYIYNTTTTNVLLEISGGRVENTSNGYAVFNNSAGGTVNISGGTVSSISLNTVLNYNTGVTNISGGTVSSISGTAVLNNSTGAVTVSGGTVSSISSTAVSNSSGTVTISGGTVSSISSSSNTVSNSGGTVTISSGTVSATSAYAVYNTTGAVTISGGTVQATTGRAVHNNSSGTVTISGGTVQATTGYAVYNSAGGTIAVSQADAAIPTLITSANPEAAQGTVYIAANTTASVRLAITGGTITNTSATTGNAVYSATASPGEVTMSGGTVQATGATARAIHNNGTGAVTITGGTVSATGSGIAATYTASFDFESGADSWVLENGTQTNKWMIGAATSHSGSSAYISNDNGTTNAYTVNSTSNVHLYKDIAFPASAVPFNLTFWFKGNGDTNDYMRLRYSETSATPAAGSAFTSGTQLGSNNYSISAWTQQNFTLPASAFSGKTMRLVFSWVNNATGGTQPPAAIDDIFIDNAAPAGYSIYNQTTGVVTVDPAATIVGARYPTL